MARHRKSHKKGLSKHIAGFKKHKKHSRRGGRRARKHGKK